MNTKVEPFESKKNKPNTKEHVYDEQMRLQNLENLDKLIQNKRQRGIPQNKPQ